MKNRLRFLMLFKSRKLENKALNILHEFLEHMLYLGREIPTERTTALMRTYITFQAERNLCTHSRHYEVLKYFFPSLIASKVYFIIISHRMHWVIPVRYPITQDRTVRFCVKALMYHLLFVKSV